MTYQDATIATIIKRLDTIDLLLAILVRNGQSNCDQIEAIKQYIIPGLNDMRAAARKEAKKPVMRIVEDDE